MIYIKDKNNRCYQAITPSAFSVDGNTVYVKDNLGSDFKLQFDDHESLNDALKSYYQNGKCMTCCKFEWIHHDFEFDQEEQEREIDPYHDGFEIT